MEIYGAWSRQTWGDVRHLVSDRLYGSNDFWIQAYKKAGLVNRLEQIKILKVELSDIELDTWFDTLTVRVHASCLDYVKNIRNELIGGSRTKARRFSEYWTFIRRAGVEKDNAGVEPATCPNCGALADKMGQSGVCEYCGTKVNTGEFSWVLTMITQDEVYRG
jgi:hypothetical protein